MHWCCGPQWWKALQDLFRRIFLCFSHEILKRQRIICSSEAAIAALFIHLVIHLAGGLFSMLSTGGNYVIHAGNKIHLQCLFTMDDFSVYENPVIWSKRQSNSTLNVNIHGSVLEPFSSTGRFHVNYYQKGLRYGLTLTITGEKLRHVRASDIAVVLLAHKSQFLSRARESLRNRWMSGTRVWLPPLGLISIFFAMRWELGKCHPQKLTSFLFSLPDRSV